MCSYYLDSLACHRLRRRNCGRDESAKQRHRRRLAVPGGPGEPEWDGPSGRRASLLPHRHAIAETASQATEEISEGPSARRADPEVRPGGFGQVLMLPLGNISVKVIQPWRSRFSLSSL